MESKGRILRHGKINIGQVQTIWDSLLVMEDVTHKPHEWYEPIQKLNKPSVKYGKLKNLYPVLIQLSHGGLGGMRPVKEDGNLTYKICTLIRISCLKKVSNVYKV